MRAAIPMILGMAALVSAPAALARILDPPPPLEFHYPDSGLSAYDKVVLDCDRLEHRYGRNAAWGHWIVPLDKVEIAAPVMDQDKAVVAMACRDGSDCIAAGKLEDTTGRIARHSLTFDTLTAAQAFIDQVKNHQGLCAMVG